MHTSVTGERNKDYDVLVVGGGIAGMEAAQTLGDMGYRVLLVEKDASIGGKMILLSKVFPTLDCASCIATPKMSATAHHPNVTTMVYSEVKDVTKRADGTFRATVVKKPTYVHPELCTGCQQCEEACTVAIPDPFNFDLVAHRAAYIPYTQAVPKKAVIERHGSSPCTFTCPAGVKAHGYVSLVRSGMYEEAFRLHLEDVPLPGSLARACYAPCEEACTRRDVDGAVPIRLIKRFMTDYYYARHLEPEYGPPNERAGKRVAVVGSGPAGLCAAFHLGKRGYDVTILEQEPEAGGMLRLGIPEYRLPNDIVDRDLKNITALGVEIETGKAVTSVASLRADGYDAVFLATGALSARRIGVEGEDLGGVVSCMEFLRAVNLGERSSLEGMTVMVVGGGNSAIDPARVAIRLGAAKVIVQYRRSRAEMPAHDWEVEAAATEGVEFQFLQVPTRFLGQDGRVAVAESLRMRLGEPDESGRRRPVPIPDSEHMTPVDLVITSIGLSPTTSPFARELALNRNGSVQVDEVTLQTSVPYLFAAGDVVTGPSNIAEAAGQGKRAADSINRYLQGAALEESNGRLAVVDKRDVLARNRGIAPRTLMRMSERLAVNRIHDFDEVEIPPSETDAREGAGRCLDCAVCSECGQCIKACPADAISLDMQLQEITVDAGAVVISTGFRLFSPLRKPQYGFGKISNVITAMQMDRLLSPTRPYNTVLRPSDGKVPDNIGFALCAGSRDRTVGNPICSQVCCMYSIKQAQLVMGALPLADITIYYLDIRAFGKGYEEFYQQAKAMGVTFVRGRVAKVEELRNGDVSVSYEDLDQGNVKHVEHDLLVLSVGIQPNPEALALVSHGQVNADGFGYVQELDSETSPGRTSMEGVFVAGTASAPRDIPDTIVHADASAVHAAAYVEAVRAGR